jgi:hypothetical protein
MKNQRIASAPSHACGATKKYTASFYLDLLPVVSVPALLASHEGEAAIDHDWLMKFIEHRIADKRVLRHIKKWLKAGVLEEGRKVVVEEDVPQGGSVSPLLANVYLHSVFAFGRSTGGRSVQPAMS